MDPQTDLPDLVEDLEVNIDELTSALQPLLDASLPSTASSLPLLGKAKLYVLAAYSIESLLFSALQANGVNAKEHAIFGELARLKGYYGKIKEAEERDVKPKARIDIPAAQRFIKHGLAGNEKYDLERAERMAKERARAALKAKMLGKKADEGGEEKSDSGVVAKKRGVEEMPSEESEGEDDEKDEAGVMGEGEERASKRLHTSSTNATESESVASPGGETKSPKYKKRNKKKKSKENADAGAQMEEGPSTPSDASRKKKKRDKKKKKAKQPSE